MMLIVALTGASGLLASFALLHAGADVLWLRYPVSVGIAYVAFLLFLWFWLRLRTTDLLDFLDIPGSSPSTSSSGGSEVADTPFELGGGQFGGGGASGSFGEGPEVTQFSSGVDSGLSGGSSSVSDAGGSLDLEELGVILVAVVALVGAAWAALWIVWSAPALLAELLLDVALSAGLYRRLRAVKGDHWLRTAVRRTAWPFVAVALLFGVAGAVMQAYAPGAKSVGEVIRHLKEVK